MQPYGRTKRIDLVYIYGSDWDTVSLRVDDLARELSSRGFNTTIVCLSRAKLQRVGMRSRQGRHRSVPRLVRIANQVAFLVQLVLKYWLERAEPKIIITIDVPSGIGWIGWYAARVSRRRTSHVSWVMDLYRVTGAASLSVVDRIRASVEFAALKRCPETVTIGNCISSEIAVRTGRVPKVIEMWHEDINASPEMVEETRFNLSPRGMPIILYSGNARAIHPLDAFVRSVRFITAGTVQLVVVGAGSSFESARRISIDEDLQDIAFCDLVPYDELPALLLAASVHVVALSEPATGSCVPSKVYAAMSAGKPCLFLGDRRSQVSIDIQAAGCGFTVPTSEPAIVAREIQRMVADTAGLQRMAAASMEFHTKFRNPGVQGARWASYLASLQGRGMGGTG